MPLIVITSAITTAFEVPNAAFFEFVFFTGMRLCEALAMRWDAVGIEKRTAHVCRGIVLAVAERTKTGGGRFV